MKFLSTFFGLKLINTLWYLKFKVIRKYFSNLLIIVFQYNVKLNYVLINLKCIKTHVFFLLDFVSKFLLKTQTWWVLVKIFKDFRLKHKNFHRFLGRLQWWKVEKMHLRRCYEFSSLHFILHQKKIELKFI